MAKKQNALITDRDTGRTSRVKHKAGLSVEHHCLYYNITEAWQMPLSAPSPNGNIQQLSYSSLSPRKSVQKLMVWDVSYSGVASPQSYSAELPSLKGSNQLGSK